MIQHYVHGISGVAARHYHHSPDPCALVIVFIVCIMEVIKASLVLLSLDLQVCTFVVLLQLWIYLLAWRLHKLSCSPQE